MKIRNGYVSNSSSSSFIVKEDLTNFGISCIKLSAELIELLHKNDAEDRAFNFSSGDTWYLTEFVGDGDDKKYERVCGAGIRYMDGGFNQPYGDKDEYIVLKNHFGDEFYLQIRDVFGSIDEIPSGIDMAMQIQKILKSKFSAKIKLQSIGDLVKHIQVGEIK